MDLKHVIPVVQYNTFSVTVRQKPKYTWSKAECRNWIRDILVLECDQTTKYAVETARKFKFDGKILWLTHKAVFEDALGTSDANKVYAHVIDSYEEEFKNRTHLAVAWLDRILANRQKKKKSKSRAMKVVVDEVELKEGEDWAS